MVSKDFVDSSEGPLHDWEFHASDARLLPPVIHSWVQDIEVLFVKIDDGRLSLRLSPDVNTHEIQREYPPMHDETHQGNHQIQNDFTVLDQKFHIACAKIIS